MVRAPRSISASMAASAAATSSGFLDAAWTDRLVQTDDHVVVDERREVVLGLAVQGALGAFGHQHPQLGPAALDDGVGAHRGRVADDVGAAEQLLLGEPEEFGTAFDDFDQTDRQVVGRGRHLGVLDHLVVGEEPVGEGPPGVDVDRIGHQLPLCRVTASS